MAEKMLSAKDVAAHFGVKISTARGWLHRRLFVGAELKASELGVSYWVVPERALKGFVLPKPGPVPKSAPNAQKSPTGATKAGNGTPTSRKKGGKR
jgi:hypothetical protein